jgi:hypothetical protein
MKILTTKIVNDILARHNKNEKLSRADNIFYQSIPNTRKSNLLFALTSEEIEEYTKCKVNVFYFIEKYCKYHMGCNSIDGPLFDNVDLLDYQKKIIEHFKDNRFSILMSSPLMNTTKMAALFFLHYLTFNIEKTILAISNKTADSVELITEIKNFYYTLPFFLKVGIKNWNQTTISFENGSFIKIDKGRTRNPAIGFSINILYMYDIASIPEDLVNNYYETTTPVIKSMQDSKIIINSRPNGFNFFYKLVQKAEVGMNDYKLMKLYWWQYPGRNDVWKSKTMEQYSLSEREFNEYYDMIIKLK